MHCRAIFYLPAYARQESSFVHRIGVSARPALQWSFAAGVDAFHFSNGSVKLPNNGLNCLGVRVGASRIFGAERLPDAGRGASPQSGEPRSFIKDMDLDLFLHTGYMFRGLYYPQHLMLGIEWSFGR